MKKIILAYFFLLSNFALAGSTPWEKKFDAYCKDLPKDVAALLKRMDECEHWTGEEPYSDDRGKEISAAIIKLKCETLDRDKTSLLKKYKKQPKVIDKVQNFPAALQ